MKPALALGVALVFVALGCSAPVCQEPNDEALTSEQVEDSLLAVGAGEEKEWHFRATLRGLPKLWPGAGALSGGRLSVQVSVAYDADPVGGDGKTEMPNVRVTFPNQPVETWQSDQTPTFAGPTPARFSAPLFDSCNVEGQAHCCRFGETECSLPVTLRFERVQGEPFPPLIVDFSAQASTSVKSCPLPGASPTLSLEFEGQ